MILPNPAYHTPRYQPTCQGLQVAMAFARAVELLRQPTRTADEDADLLQAAHCCTEGAALLGRHDLRLRATALLIQAHEAVGQTQAALVQRRRLERLAGEAATFLRS